MANALNTKMYANSLRLFLPFNRFLRFTDELMDDFEKSLCTDLGEGG